MFPQIRCNIITYILTWAGKSTSHSLPSQLSNQTYWHCQSIFSLDLKSTQHKEPWNAKERTRIWAIKILCHYIMQFQTTWFQCLIQESTLLIEMHLDVGIQTKDKLSMDLKMWNPFWALWEFRGEMTVILWTNQPDQKTECSHECHGYKATKLPSRFCNLCTLHAQ